MLSSESAVRICVYKHHTSIVLVGTCLKIRCVGFACQLKVWLASRTVQIPLIVKVAKRVRRCAALTNWWSSAHSDLYARLNYIRHDNVHGWLVARTIYINLIMSHSIGEWRFVTPSCSQCMSQYIPRYVCMYCSRSWSSEDNRDGDLLYNNK